MFSKIKNQFQGCSRITQQHHTGHRMLSVLMVEKQVESQHVASGPTPGTLTPSTVPVMLVMTPPSGHQHVKGWDRMTPFNQQQPYETQKECGSGSKPPRLESSITYSLC